MNQNSSSIAELMMGDAILCEDDLYLGLGECILRIRSNSPALIKELTGYFSHVVIKATTETMEVIAIQRNAPQVGVDFTDWKREPG
jgi:hypothetical protein